MSNGTDGAARLPAALSFGPTELKAALASAVEVRAADWNGSAFDGMPFSSAPDWLVAAVDDGRVRPDTPRHTDYAEWRVENADRNAEWATPGDWLVRLPGGYIHVLPYNLVKMLNPGGPKGGPEGASDQTAGRAE